MTIGGEVGIRSSSPCAPLISDLFCSLTCYRLLGEHICRFLPLLGYGCLEREGALSQYFGNEGSLNGSECLPTKNFGGLIGFDE